jgi:hypothetical protein
MEIKAKALTHFKKYLFSPFLGQCMYGMSWACSYCTK